MATAKARRRPTIRTDAAPEIAPTQVPAPEQEASAPAPRSTHSADHAPSRVQTRARPTGVRKFTAQLDADTDARYARVLDELRRVVGPIATRADRDRMRSGYDVSRADLLRALLVVAEDDPTVLGDVAAAVRTHYRATTP